MTLIKNWMFVNAMGEAEKPEISLEEPEFSQTRLFGYVYGDSRSDALTSEFNDGHRIITSPIREMNWEKKFVKTRSGTTYNLSGHPHEDYIRWLTEQNLWEQYCNDLLPIGN